MAATLKEMDRVGYGLVRSEPVIFMTEAIALDRSFGFLPCKPFSPVGLETITIYMGSSSLTGRSRRNEADDRIATGAPSSESIPARTGSPAML